MNILFITPYLPSETSGHAGAQLIYRNVVALSKFNKITIASFLDRYEHEMSKKLSSHGIDVHTIKYPRNQKTISGKITSLFTNIKPAISYILGNEPFFIAKYNKSAMSELIIKLTSSNSFDLVQVEYNVMHHYTNLFDHIKSLIVFHDVSTKLYETGSLVGKKSNKRLFQLAKKVESNIANKFDSVVTLTEEDKKYLLKLGCKKDIKVIPPQIKKIKNSHSNKIENSICFIGSFNREPNTKAIGIIIDSILPKLDKKITFNIVGKGLSKKIISKINNHNRINYLGFIDDIDSFLASQMLLVAPINIGSGLKMKIPHALSCGTSVITTNIGAEGIKVNEDAGLVKSEINYFAIKINQLMNNQKKLIEMGEYGKNKVNALFSEKKITEKFQRLYKSIDKI